MRIESDIYFSDDYAKLNEYIENGKAESFTYSDENGLIKSSFIKREIPIDVGSGTYYDIVSPYGYGGPIIVNCTNKEALMKGFEEKFSQYCMENNIVSEFIRFHPICNNGKEFESIYNSKRIRNTVGTNLKDYDDPVKGEFSKSCKKNIKRALKEGVTYRIKESPESLGEFKSIYYATMDRNNASEYYYFTDEYFDGCLRFFKDKLMIVEAIYEGKVIATSLNFISGKTIHVHLSGTLTEYMWLSPAYIVKYATAIWGKENRYELIHYGGGTSNSDDDSLYQFKQKFGINTSFDFYVGRKVWDERIYKKMCEIKGVSEDIDFFPAYRGV